MPADTAGLAPHAHDRRRPVRNAEFGSVPTSITSAPNDGSVGGASDSDPLEDRHSVQHGEFPADVVRNCAELPVQLAV